MGLWPGEHFRNRYQVLDEYACILRASCGDRPSDFKGDHYYTMDDCLVRLTPSTDMKIICAGSSDEGRSLAFGPVGGFTPFCLGKGSTPLRPSPSTTSRLAVATAKTGPRRQDARPDHHDHHATDESRRRWRWKTTMPASISTPSAGSRTRGRRQGQRYYQRPLKRRT
jgi:hypothetical protein